MRQSWETMTSVSAGHIIQTPTQPVGSGRPQRESNPGPPHQESRALPQSYRAPPQQGQWTNWDNAMQKSLTWNDIWHMVPLRISFLIRSVYDLLPSNANLIRWGKKEDPTCPLCNGGQTTEHVLSSCKVALSHGRYTWRHN